MACLMTGFRAVSALRVFYNYRVFIQLLKQTIFDMTIFLALLLYMILLFSLIRYTRLIDPDNTEPPSFKNQIIFQYLVMFGENPKVFELQKSHTFAFTYFAFTLMVNIVSLNLLIAVISNTFDCVQNSLDAHHVRTKAQILQDISSFMTWDRDKVERKYLHIVHNASDHLDSLLQDENEFEGRVRVITNKIDEVHEDVRRI